MVNSPLVPNKQFISFWTPGIGFVAKKKKRKKEHSHRQRRTRNVMFLKSQQVNEIDFS